MFDAWNRLMGVQIITDQYMTKTLHDGRIVRRLNKARKNGRKIKVYRIPPVIVPDDHVLYLPNGTMVCHPAIYHKLAGIVNAYGATQPQPGALWV